MLLILLALCLRKPNGISRLFSIAYAFDGNGWSDIELAYDKAAIERGTLITVTTAAEQWAYAAAIPLHPTGEAQGVMLKLRTLVTRGEIGVGILASDQKHFITEQRYGPAAEPVDILLPMPSPAEGCRLIIRNTAPNATASQVVLESIEMWKLD